MKMDLSIIIPLYNTEKYISECIDSLLNISIENFEIIIINDGSTDNSEKIVIEYQKKFENIKYYKQENAGQGAARNYGIKVATGKYIYFMDSDDILNSDEFSQMLEKAKKDNLDAIFFDGKSFMGLEEVFNNNFNTNNFDYSRNKSYGKFESGEDLYVSMSKKSEFMISPCLYIVKSNIYKDYKLTFPLNMKHEDEVFTTKLPFFIGKCSHEKKVVFRRRIRPNSTMTNYNYDEKFGDHVKVLEHLSDFYIYFKFETLAAKKIYLKKMRKIFIIALKLFKFSSLTKEDAKYIRLMKIGNKYRYFDFLGKLAANNIDAYLLIVSTYIKINDKLKGGQNAD